MGRATKGAAQAMLLKVYMYMHDYQNAKTWGDKFLKDQASEYNLAADGGYVLMNDATHGLAFYKNQNVFTVGANTAYLPADFLGTLQSRSFFSFDGKVTGIDAALKDKGQMKSDVYNLNGQRVKKATKGLYIVNGKKYVK